MYILLSVDLKAYMPRKLCATLYIEAETIMRCLTSLGVFQKP